MDGLSGFLREGFSALRDALAEAAGRAGLHLKPETLSLTAARRFRRMLGVIETMLRRLLVLMALELALDPPAPARATPGTRPQPDTVRQRSWGFALMPLYRYDAAGLAALAERTCSRARGPVPIAPLLHRWRTLTGLIEDPSRAARAMARLIAKIRARRETPLCLPQEALYRLPARLGLLAGALPLRVNEALGVWNDSG